MKYLELSPLRNRLYFSTQDVAEILEIKPSSAKVFCSRYVEKGLFVRLKKDFYIFKEKWLHLSYQDYYKIANILQVPSYISLMTALLFYEVTTQVQRGFLESVCIRKTVRFDIEGINFNFYKLQKNLYFDFVKEDDFFIATKEKAFLDVVYLSSLRRYAFDLDSIDISKLDMRKVKKLLEHFPERTKRSVKKICRI